jgi:translation initiation factor IF-3
MVPEVRLVGPEGEQLGVVPIAEALQKAAPRPRPGGSRSHGRTAGLPHHGLREVQVHHEQAGAGGKEEQTVIQVKEIKVRPKTEEHDIATKLKHIRRFLEDGDKVKVTVRFRGRELAYASQSGFEVLKNIVESIADIAKVESPPKMEGKTMMTIVAPTFHKKKPVGGVAKAASPSPVEKQEE